MKIVLNTRLLIKDKLSGIGWVTLEIAKRLVISHPEHEFYFLFDRPYSKEFIFATNVHPIVIFPPTRHPFLWYIWFEWRIPGILRKLKPDLFLSFDGFMSLSSAIPQISMIHDIIFEHRPKDVPFLVEKYYKYFFPKFAHIAEKIITVSEFSRQDIIQCYGIPSDKIEVVNNGANPEFTPSCESEIKDTRNRYSEGLPYFIYVGLLHPRKNLEGLLLAFDRFKTKFSGDQKLIIVGTRMSLGSNLDKILDELHSRKDVIFTGWVSTKDMRLLLGAAISLVYVPFLEGFGIPVIEAMYCGVPVITSNTSSLPEIAGDAALYSDPNSIDSIANAMNQMAYNETLSTTLIRKGNQQKLKYNWDESAKKVWDIIVHFMETKQKN